VTYLFNRVRKCHAPIRGVRLRLGPTHSMTTLLNVFHRSVDEPKGALFEELIHNQWQFAPTRHSDGPSFTNRFAVARPIQLLPPAISVTWPSSLPIDFLVPGHPVVPAISDSSNASGRTWNNLRFASVVPERKAWFSLQSLSVGALNSAARAGSRFYGCSQDAGVIGRARRKSCG
jgi:hypothetical protein